MATKIDWDRRREEWRGLVTELTQEITAWAEGENWLVDTQQKVLSEEHLGSYEVPDLVIRLPEGRIVVEVIGRNVVGAEGRVDISAFPALNRMLLVRVGDEWKVKTDARVDWPRSWGRDTFIELAKVLVNSS